jgi:lipoprotein-anchoring transpeptidase ErfK/SrfK
MAALVKSKHLGYRVVGLDALLSTVVLPRYKMRIATFSLVVLLLTPVGGLSAQLDAGAVNSAEWRGSTNDEALLVKAQTLLDRAGFSPGEIDGRAGDNFRKALNAFAQERELDGSGQLSERVWRELAATSSEPVVVEYKLSDKDISGPFLEKVPSKLDEMRGLQALSYGSTKEKIAEQFHMSEALLAALNPGKKFDRPGETIFVVQGGSGQLPTKAAKLEIDKSAQTLRALAKDGKLIAAFPITAGSAAKPAPSGELRIRNVAQNPTYRYNPEYEFKGVRSKEAFTIAPGPNNPVGVVWIGLPGEGYGIHGTPDPSKIGKSESHGCIRLTNWDALRLAQIVSKGTLVSLTGDEKAKAKRPRRR